MLYLNQLDHASEEERNTEIYRWARLISAKDWKVLMEMAKHNEYMKEAVNETEKINSDPALRYRYLQRELAEADEATIREFYTKEGVKEGIEKGEERINRLNLLLLSEKRYEDLERASSDKQYQNQLMKHYGIE